MRSRELQTNERQKTMEKGGARETERGKGAAKSIEERPGTACGSAGEEQAE